MCITELIVLLSETLDEHGDCTVEVRNRAGDYDTVAAAVHYNDGTTIPTVLLDV